MVPRVITDDRNSMKNLISVIAIGACVGLLLAGCSSQTGSGKSDGSGTVTVNAVTGEEAAWIKAATPGFEKKYPKIKISENTETQAQFLANAAQLYSSSSAPDLGFLQTNTTAYPLLVKAGAL